LIIEVQMLLLNLLMQKLKLLEPNLEGLEIYNSSFLDSQIFSPKYQIPQLYDLIPFFEIFYFEN